ncbi:MAG: maleylpyruvate isomerase family mycothiol-dependent enzyme [Janthinobacterium lividum]
MADTTAWIQAVRSSFDRFSGILRPLSSAQVETRSYAEDWSIADTASHLGSQAEIFGLFLDAGLAGAPAPGGDAFPPIWDRWNAADPTEQVRRSVDANEAFVARIEELSEGQRDDFALAAFGRDLDLSGLLSMRLAELAVHTWDIAVALDPSATVSADAVDLLVDELPATVVRAGQVTDDLEPVDVVTTDPARTFALDPRDQVTLQPTAAAGPDPLVLPAEALLRLVYGRLDPGHTPSGLDDPRLAGLRAVFPGF